MSMYMCYYVCDLCVQKHLWSSKDNFVELLFFSCLYTCSRMELRLLEVVQSTFTHWAISLVPMMKVFAYHKGCCTHELTEAVILYMTFTRSNQLKFQNILGRSSWNPDTSWGIIGNWWQLGEDGLVFFRDMAFETVLMPQGSSCTHGHTGSIKWTSWII